jgi:hypothetical protein
MVSSTPQSRVLQLLSLYTTKEAILDFSCFWLTKIMAREQEHWLGSICEAPPGETSFV